MIRKIGGYIAGFLIVVGIFVIMGTAGASDNEAIGLTQMMIQSGIGLVMVLIGYLLAVKIGGIENLD